MDKILVLQHSRFKLNVSVGTKATHCAKMQSNTYEVANPCRYGSDEFLRRYDQPSVCVNILLVSSAMDTTECKSMTRTPIKQWNHNNHLACFIYFNKRNFQTHAEAAQASLEIPLLMFPKIVKNVYIRLPNDWIPNLLKTMIVVHRSCGWKSSQFIAKMGSAN